MDRSVANLVNIGSKMAAYLAEIGITQESQMRERGVIVVYRQLKEQHPRIMNRLVFYAIYGALSDQNCLHLPAESKEWLELQLREIMGADYTPPAKALL